MSGRSSFVFRWRESRHTHHLFAALVLIGLLGATSASAQEALEPTGEAEGQRARQTSVFLIVTDAAAARYIGSYGGSGSTTPRIDAFAKESVIFETAYSQSATTVPSTVSLFTGVRATTHRAAGYGAYSKRLQSIAEILQRNGFSTASIVGNPLAGLERLGFSRGFDRTARVWEEETTDPSGEPGKPRRRITKPSDLNRVIQPWLAEKHEGHRFYYIHYLRPHEPYTPPADLRPRLSKRELRRCGEPPAWPELLKQRNIANRKGESEACLERHLRSTYLGNLSFVDRAIGELFGWLRQEGLYEESIIVFTSDHGEAFFEHRLYGHNKTLYDDMVRIPLVIRFPASAGIRPQRIAVPVESIDILPTLLDYLGLPIPKHAEGDSLWPLVVGRVSTLGDDEVVMTTNRRHIHAIRVGDHKLIYRSKERRTELYDLALDPREQRNLAPEQPELAEALHARLRKLAGSRAGGPWPKKPPKAPTVEPQLRDLLEALGYTEEREAE